MWINLPWPVQTLDMTLYNHSIDPNQYAISVADYQSRHGAAELTLRRLFPAEWQRG